MNLKKTNPSIQTKKLNNKDYTITFLNFIDFSLYHDFLRKFCYDLKSTIFVTISCDLIHAITSW